MWAQYSLAKEKVVTSPQNAGGEEGDGLEPELGAFEGEGIDDDWGQREGDGMGEWR